MQLIPPLEQVREHSRRMVRELGLLQEPHSLLGVTPSQCHALIEIDRHGILSSAELADLLWLDRSTTSRLVRSLVREGYVQELEAEDRRFKPLQLTPSGKKRLSEVNHAADRQVLEALAWLDELQVARVQEGIQLYANALAKARSLREFAVRPARKSDNPAIAKVIRTVMPEFGATGPGYSIMDPEVGAMFQAYDRKGAGLWVVERNGKVVGCGGFAPLEGGAKDVCEVKKMYFLQETRGHGVGRKLLGMIVQGAREAGYKTVYLETLDRMHAAKALYESFGFKPLCSPLGKTGHDKCDAWYAFPLS